MTDEQLEQFAPWNEAVKAACGNDKGVNLEIQNWSFELQDPGQTLARKKASGLCTSKREKANKKVREALAYHVIMKRLPK